MKLTKEQIFAATRGTLNIIDDGGVYRFRRLPADVTAAWFREAGVLGYRSLTTAGVRFDFVTDSKTLSVLFDREENDTYTFPSSAKFKCDVEVDRLLYRHFEEDAFVANGNRISCDLPEGTHRVTVYFPSHRIAAVREFSLSDGATFSPFTDYKKKFLFIGDSITQGWMSVYDSISYAYRTAASFDADLLNQGIGGSYFLADGFSKINYQPDVVFVALGTNDFGHYGTLDDMKKAMDAELDRISAAYPDAVKIGISPLMRLDLEKARKIGTFAEVCDLVRASITQHGFHLVDGFTLVPHDKEFLADGILHPNDLGFTLYAEHLIREVRDLVR